MSNPTVTVLMSCYNASRYLSEAIESILAQTYADFEFLLINDGSSDETLDIITRYADKDARLRVIDKENTGLADSLNVGLKAARGHWIARLDADDVACPARLERQIAFVEGDCSARLLGTGCILIDEFGHEIGQHRYPCCHEQIVHHMELGHSPFPHSSVLLHRETICNHSGYNPRFLRCQDMDLWFRISEDETIASLPSPLVRLRKHPSNVSNDANAKPSWILSTAARVCHFIRLRDMPDPSQSLDESVWTTFVDWLIQRMQEEQYFESHRQWAEMRSTYYGSLGSGRKMRGTFHLARSLLTSEHAYKIIKKKLFGSNLASKLADKWIMEPLQGSVCRSPEDDVRMRDRFSCH